MARYDDGGITFAEKQFKEARDYKEKVAKEQDTFAKRLFGFDTVVKGASFLINRNAEEADAKRLPQKAKYQALNTRALNFRTSDEERVKAGMSVIDYLSDKYYTQLSAKAGQQYSYLNKSQYDKAIRAESDRLATENAPEYNDVLKIANNIPSFEDFTEFYEDQADVPRNLFSWLTKGTKKFFTKETEETIKYKNEKARDALYGTEMFDKYKNLSTSFHAYDIATGDGLKVKKIIDNLHIKTGGANKDFTKEITGPSIYDYDKGTITTSKEIWIGTNRLDGSGTIEYLPENKHVVATSVKLMTDDEQGFASEESIKNLYDLVKPQYRKNIDEYLSSGNVTKDNIDDARKWLNQNSYAYTLDGSNMKALEEGFEKWMSIHIQNIKLDKNGVMSHEDGYDKDSGVHIAHDPESDGIFTIVPAWRGRAELRNITAPILKTQYLNQFGQPPEDEKELDFKPVNINTFLTSENAAKFDEYIKDRDGDFFDLFKNKLTMDPSRFVDLGTFDLNKNFADFDFPENEKEYNIFYDRETKKVIIKK